MLLTEEGHLDIEKLELLNEEELTEEMEDWGEDQWYEWDTKDGVRNTEEFSGVLDEMIDEAYSEGYISTFANESYFGHAIKDRTGVLYSDDGKRLFKCTNKSLRRYVVKEGTEVVCDESFLECSLLSEMIIPNSVKAIGKRSFKGCKSLAKVTIPIGVIKIANAAFAGCDALAGFDVAEGSEHFCAIDGILFSKDKATLVQFPGASPFLPCYEIPNFVTSIGEGAFDSCKRLKQLTITSNVISIGDDAFVNCPSLVQVNYNATACMFAGRWPSVFKDSRKFATLAIGDNVTQLPKFLFELCYGLTEVYIPSSVIEIGKKAFHNCINLREVWVLGDEIKIGDEVFGNSWKLTNVHLPDNATLGERVFDNCTKLDK